MSRPGTLLYRCRQCGERIAEPRVPDVATALGDAILGDRLLTRQIVGGMLARHACGGGKVGVADLVGAAEDEA